MGATTAHDGDTETGSAEEPQTGAAGAAAGDDAASCDAGTDCTTNIPAANGSTRPGDGPPPGEPPAEDRTRDSDGDGSPDIVDECPDDGNKTRPGPCGCGATDTDADGDGTLDCDDGCPDDPEKQEAGACGCGVVDSDADEDGTPDCDDGCPNDALKIEPGDCGCGRPDEDLDGDGDVECIVAEDALVSAGFTHSCARGGDGQAYCWGAGGYGRLGSGSSAGSNVPVLVTGLADVVQVSSRGFGDSAMGCAVLAAGGVRCWGYGATGGMGNGSTTLINESPVVVSGLTDALQVAVGTQHVCAVRRDGSIACWGEGSNGRLGNGSSSRAPQPVAVQGIDDALQVSAGHQHSCAVRAGGTVHCWGERGNGRLGDGGDTSGSQLTPALVGGIDGALQVSAGNQHSCAVRSDGTVACWGLRNDGRLGDAGDTSGNQATPVTVSAIDDALQVSAGGRHSCAVLADGRVMCWGLRSGGRMGDGMGGSGAQATPVAVAGIADAVQVVVGNEHSCAALASGAVQCWGPGGSGRLGNGAAQGAEAPVMVSGLP